MTEDRSEALDALRVELDQIDDRILDLIERRLSASAEIAAVKNADGGDHLELRARRRAQILERLKGRASRAAPALVDRIWREIMAYTLQSQGTAELELAPSDEPELLEARVREHFGSATPIRWAAGTSHALRSARRGEAVAIIPEPLSEEESELRIFDLIETESGRALACAAGRVAAAEVSVELPAPKSAKAPERAGEWSPGSWRGRPAKQLVDYPDAKALARVERRLSGSETLVEIADIIHLRAALARVPAEGVHPGGMHLEMTGGDVTECIGASPRLAREDLDRDYLTHCDPRLNEQQAIDVAHVATDHLARRARRSRAA